MKSHVKQSICNELYSAFSGVDKPKVIHSCSCCHSDQDKEKLLKGTQRDVPKKLIYDLEFSWLNTFGDERDLHYFTPCILDAYLSQAPLLQDEDYIYNLLLNSGLFNWPIDQQKAVKRAYIAICKANDSDIPDRINSI